MHADHNVVAFTPYGRARTVSLLYPYLRREHERGILDRWMLWINVDERGQEADLEYARGLVKRHPDWISWHDRPQTAETFPDQWKQQYTRFFYPLCTDPATIYLRFDDDIVYVHEDTIARLVEEKISRTSVLGLFPIIWNNAICTWQLQQRRNIPGADEGWPVVQAPYCMDPVGWADPHLAELMHNLLIDRLHDGDVKSCFMYQDVQLAPGQQFSVSCFAVDGNDYRALEPPGVLDYHEEEHWLTVHRPGVVNKSNVILGSALVSHFSFFPQREVLMRTNILDRYRELAVRLT